MTGAPFLESAKLMRLMGQRPSLDITDEYPKDITDESATRHKLMRLMGQRPSLDITDESTDESFLYPYLQHATS